MAGPGPSADFVRAVSLTFDVTADPSLRTQANASLDQLRNSEDGWHWVLQQFGAASEEHVKFWCLQTLVDMVSKHRRYASLPESQKQTLRQALVSWLQANGAQHTDQPASVKNKFAQLLVRDTPPTLIAHASACRCALPHSACPRCLRASSVSLPMPASTPPASHLLSACPPPTLARVAGGRNTCGLPGSVARRLRRPPVQFTKWPRRHRCIPARAQCAQRRGASSARLRLSPALLPPSSSR